MDTRNGGRTALRRRRRCLLRESREAERDGEEPEVLRHPARPLPSGAAEEGR